MSKLVFNKVRMQNFMAFGNVPTELSLNSGETFGIIGDNRDIGETGSSRNGASKTSMMAGVIYAAYGRSIDKLRADEFINITNGNKMIVELEFSKNGVDYLIKRGRKPNFLTFHATIDGETTDLTRDSMANTDVDIAATLGMTFDVFMTTVFLSPHRDSFHEMGGPMQRSTIEQMLSLDVLSERAEGIKTMRTEYGVDVRIKERELELHTTQVEQWEGRLVRLESSAREWNEGYERDVVETSEALVRINELPLNEIEKTLAEEQDAQNKLKLIETGITNLDNDVRSIRSHNRQHQQITEDLEKLQSEEVEDARKLEEDMRAVIEALDAIGDVSDLPQWVSSYSTYKSLMRDHKQLQLDIERTNETIERNKKNQEQYHLELRAIKDGICHVCGSNYEDEQKLKKTEVLLLETIETIATQTQLLIDKEEKLFHNETAISEIDDTVKELTEDDIKSLNDVIDEEKELQQRKKMIEGRETRDYAAATKTLQVRLQELGDAFSSEDIDKLLADRDNKTDESSKLSLTLETIREKLSDWGIKTLAELNSIINRRGVLEAYWKRLEVDTNPHLNELSQHKKEKPSSNDVLEKELEELNQRITHCNYLIKLLTDSKSFIRRGILERYVPFLNRKVNEYLQQIGLSHVVEVTTDLNVEIIYMQKNVSYYNLSRGERLRLNIATTLAFRDMMVMVGKSTNLLLLDEVLDSGLDESGIISASVLLQQSADDVFLISHREDLLATLDNIITVIKENGFSRIEMN